MSEVHESAPDEEENERPEWLGKYAARSDLSTTYDQRRDMDRHEQAMTALRDKLTEARRLYEESIVAINTQRAEYRRVHDAWWEELFPGGRGGSARTPDHILALSNALDEAADVVFGYRDDMSRWRVGITMLERAHARGESSVCPSCGYAAAILVFDRDEDVSECCLCQHTQIRRVFDLRFTPHRPKDAAVKWERGPRTKTYYI